MGLMPVRLQLFLDESGLGQTDFFIFAGFLGTVRMWERFTRAWQPLLNEPPKLSAKGFKNHLRRKRNSKRLLDFVRILADSGVHRVSSIIPRVAFERAIFDELPKWQGRLEPEVIQLLQNEYYFGFWHILMHVLLPMSWVNKNLRLEVIYDLNIQEEVKLKTGYRGLIENVPEANLLADEPHGESDDELMPLQAADLVAWHVRRDCLEAEAGRKHNDTVWAALKSLSTYPESILNENDLRQIVGWSELEKNYQEQNK